MSAEEWFAIAIALVLVLGLTWTLIRQLWKREGRPIQRVLKWLRDVYDTLLGAG